MSESPHYSINHTKLVFEKFDDEVVLINLDNGNYFSIRSTAELVWDLFGKGHSAIAIAQALSKTFDTPESETLANVHSFADQLVKEGLICVENTSGNNDGVEINLDGKSYSKPILEVYSDMQDLILLDPIHEVDDTGWPNTK